MDKNWYFMRGPAGPVGPFQLSENEVQPLRDKGWLVVDMKWVDQSMYGHLHIVDENGQYIGARVLDQVQVGEHRRLGHHLTHVGDASKDMGEVRAIQALQQ